MPDEVSIRPTDDGDYIISRDGVEGEVTITPQHLIKLAGSLPSLARQVLQELHGPKSSSPLVAISGLNVEKILVQYDLLGETVLLQMTDKEGMESSFVLPVVHAKRLGEQLLETAAKAEKKGQQSKQ